MIAAPDQLAWLALTDILSGQPIQLPVDQTAQFDPAPIANQIMSGGPAADCFLADSLTRDLYGQPVMLSVSRLERYALCPFQHLSDHLLRLQDRPVWAPQTAETGIVLHGIMELAIDRLRQEVSAVDPADSAALLSLWQSWLQRDLEMPVRAWMDEVIRRDGLDRFLDHGLQASVGRRIRKTALSSIRAVLNHYQDQGCDTDQPFLPVILEWVFGVAGPLLSVPVADGSWMHLRGKVDRIDERLAPEGRQFRIIDYKSGNKRVDYEDLYQGLALQMPIYLAAYRQANPGVQAADAAYLHLSHPIATLSAGESTDPAAIQAKLLKAQDLRGMNLSSDDLTRLCDHALQQAARYAADMLRGAFPASPCKKPGGRPACDFCTYQALCGFDQRNNAYRRPSPLRGRKNPDGKNLSKKEEMILRLREQAGIRTDKREG
jgi:ATP-dependent helicase/nuclease subunit B